MKSIGVEKEAFDSRYMEVYNKIDLVSPEELD